MTDKKERYFNYGQVILLIFIFGIFISTISALNKLDKSINELNYKINKTEERIYYELEFIIEKMPIKGCKITEKMTKIELEPNETIKLGYNQYTEMLCEEGIKHNNFEMDLGFDLGVMYKNDLINDGNKILTCIMKSEIEECTII